MTLPESYEEIKNQSFKEIKEAEDSGRLEELRVKFLGRKGLLNSLFTQMGSIPQEERPQWGSKLNNLKKEIESIIKQRKAELNEVKQKEEFFDPTLPANIFKLPSLHPLRKVMDEIVNIFVSMGFGVAYGPEIESNYYNFTALNIPADHPARDMHDTFYLEDKDMVLRTHTSPVQVRMMEKYKPPYKFIAPGKCFRRDTIDASHSPAFHQVEGLMVNEHISFAHLKGVLDEFAKKIFPGEIITRFRPSFFPFTEPSAEMDIKCTICKGRGCPSCSGKGWLEIMGAGMVDPAVFEYCEIDYDKWQGFAFGMGVERIAMLKYGIHDMRHFYQNDIRFLEQF